jgi:tRNA-specific adenosine deaminase 2
LHCIGLIGVQCLLTRMPAPDPKPKKNRELKTEILPISTPQVTTPSVPTPAVETTLPILNQAAQAKAQPT